MVSFRRARRRALRALPLPLLERLVVRRVIGLHYHLIAERTPAHARHLLEAKTPEQFESDLLYLKRHYRLLGYEDLLRPAPARPPRRPGVLVSFDDGYAECHAVAAPLLQRHGVPCIFFVTTGFLDNRALFYRNKGSLCVEALRARAAPAPLLAELSALAARPLRDARAAERWLLDRAVDRAALDRACALLGVDEQAVLREQRPYLTTAQVRDLAAQGFTIGGHTVSHPELQRLEPAAVEHEIVQSCRRVCELTGARTVPFAFPFTGKGLDRDMLAGIRARAPEVGLMFATRRLFRDREFVVQRIPADRPPEGGAAESTLPDDLRSAYLNQIGRGAGDLARGLLPLSAAGRRDRPAAGGTRA